MAGYPWLMFAIGLGASTAFCWFASRHVEWKNRDQRTPVVFALAIVALGVGLTRTCGVDERYYHRVAETPCLAVRDMRPGPACVTGRILAGDSFRSPLFDTSCVFCRYRVSKVGGTGRSRSWFCVTSQNLYNWFAVDDGTARVMVWPAEAGTDLTMGRLVEGTPMTGGATMSHFWDRAGLNPGELHIWGDDQIRIWEGALQWGQTVTVLGTVRATTEKDVEARKAGAKWVMEGQPGARLQLTDRSPDDWATSAAWEFLWVYLVCGAVTGVGVKSLLARALGAP